MCETDIMLTCLNNYHMTQNFGFFIVFCNQHKDILSSHLPDTDLSGTL